MRLRVAKKMDVGQDIEEQTLPSRRKQQEETTAWRGLKQQNKWDQAKVVTAGGRTEASVPARAEAKGLKRYLGYHNLPALPSANKCETHQLSPLLL